MDNETEQALIDKVMLVAETARLRTHTSAYRDAIPRCHFGEVVFYYPAPHPYLLGHINSRESMDYFGEFGLCPIHRAESDRNGDNDIDSATTDNADSDGSMEVNSEPQRIEGQNLGG